MQPIRLTPLLRSEASRMTLLSFLAGSVLVVLSAEAVSRIGSNSLHQLVFRDAEPAQRWTVGLIFHPKECPARMDLVERLNRMARSGVDVRGVLVVDRRRFENWQDLVRANRLAFPVHPERPGTVALALRGFEGLPTPILVVYDPQQQLRLATDLTTGPALDQLLAEVARSAPDPVSPRE
jgi:hypothetical protein